MQQAKLTGVMVPLTYNQKDGLLKGDALDQSMKWQQPVASMNPTQQVPKTLLKIRASTDMR